MAPPTRGADHEQRRHPITAALQELAAQHERITQLDTREAGDFSALSERLAELADLITGIGHTLEDDAATLARFEALDRQVAEMAAQFALPTSAATILTRPRLGGSSPPPNAKSPSPACTPGSSRSTALATATWLPPSAPAGPPTTCACTAWTSCPPCGRSLYLQPSRNARLLSAQAEYQARILPALAAQLMTETSTCGHPRGRVPVPGQPWSAS